MHGGNVWQGGAPGDWLDFSANIRPEGPPEWVRTALADALCEVSYYPDLAMRRAREGLAAYLGLDPARVLPTAGGIAAISLVNGLDADTVTVTAPGFGEYAATALQAGKRVRSVPFDPRAARSPAEALLQSGVLGGVVWLCDPQNPTGGASAPEEVEALLSAVERAGGWLAVDEAFIDYCPELSARRLLAEHARLIVVGSLTKILGIPGVRLGYVCAAPEVIREFEQRQLPWSLNCFASAVAGALPEHVKEILLDAQANRVRREGLRAALQALGVFVYPSEAPFLLAHFDRPVAAVAAKLKERRILVRECLDFAGIDDGRHLRLAVKTEAANARLIADLREALTCAENP